MQRFETVRPLDDDHAVKRFRRGKLQKARAGHWIAGQAPYGYRYVPNRDGVPGHLGVEEAEAGVVRMLYRWLIDERMKHANRALVLCALSGMLVCVVIAGLFLGAMFNLPLGQVMAMAFVIAMLLLIGGLILFLMEIRIAVEMSEGRADLTHIREIAAIARRLLGNAYRQHIDDETLRRALLAGYPDRVAMRREPGSPRFLLAGGTSWLLGLPAIHINLGDDLGFVVGAPCHLEAAL